jgi:hypothetical protein
MDVLFCGLQDGTIESYFFQKGADGTLEFKYKGVVTSRKDFSSCIRLFAWYSVSRDQILLLSCNRRGILLYNTETMAEIASLNSSEDLLGADIYLRDSSDVYGFLAYTKKAITYLPVDNGRLEIDKAVVKETQMEISCAKVYFDSLGFKRAVIAVKDGYLHFLDLRDMSAFALNTEMDLTNCEMLMIKDGRFYVYGKGIVGIVQAKDGTKEASFYLVDADQRLESKGGSSLSAVGKPKCLYLISSKATGLFKCQVGPYGWL